MIIIAGKKHLAIVVKVCKKLFSKNCWVFTALTELLNGAVVVIKTEQKERNGKTFASSEFGNNLLSRGRSCELNFCQPVQKIKVAKKRTKDKGQL